MSITLCVQFVNIMMKFKKCKFRNENYLINNIIEDYFLVAWYKLMVTYCAKLRCIRSKRNFRNLCKKELFNKYMCLKPFVSLIINGI